MTVERSSPVSGFYSVSRIMSVPKVAVRSEKRADTIRREFREAQEIFANYD